MKPSDDRGFTLIEVLIAMVILTVALVSMAELMAITLRMQMLGRNQTSAMRLAQDKIDELMSKTFLDAVAAPDVQLGGSLTADDANHFDIPVDEDGNMLGYQRRWLVRPGPVDPGVDADSLRIITVRIIPVVNDMRVTNTTDLTSIIRCWPCP